MSEVQNEFRNFCSSYAMLTFCPECGTTLQIEEGAECMQFSCPCCPYICPVTKKVSSKIFPKLKDLDEVLGGPGAWENAQITDVVLSMRQQLMRPQMERVNRWHVAVDTKQSAYLRNFVYLVRHYPIVVSSTTLAVIALFVIAPYIASYILFSLVWLLWLRAVFFLISHFCRFYPLLHNASWYISAIITGSVFMVLLKELEERFFPQQSFYNIFEQPPRGSIWALNPLFIFAELLSIVAVKIFSMIAICLSSYIGAFFETLPWIISIPLTVMFSLIVSGLLLVLCGCELSVGYGFLRVTHVAKRK